MMLVEKTRNQSKQDLEDVLMLMMPHSRDVLNKWNWFQNSTHEMKTVFFLFRIVWRIETKMKKIINLNSTENKSETKFEIVKVFSLGFIIKVSALGSFECILKFSWELSIKYKIISKIYPSTNIHCAQCVFDLTSSPSTF